MDSCERIYDLTCLGSTPVTINATATNGSILKCYFIVRAASEPIYDSNGFEISGPDSLRRYADWVVRSSGINNRESAGEAI